MNYYRNLKIIVLLITLILVGSSCAKSPALEIKETENEADSVSLNPVNLKLGISPYLSNTVFMIAQKEGFFEEQGLNVEFVPISSTSTIIPSLLAEEIDISAPGLSAAFFNAVSRGGNIKIIMPLTDFTIKDCSTIAFLARKTDLDSGKYFDKKDWTKAKIVVSVNGLTSTPGYVLGNAMATVNLTVDDVQIEVVDLPAQEEALRNGQIDIVYAVEPWITRMTAKGDISILDPAEQYAPDLTSSVLVAGPKINDNPDIGNRFAIAYLKAVRQYLEGPTDRNIEYAAEITGLSTDLVKQICWSDSSPDGRINMNSLIDYKNWLMDRGLLDEDVVPEKFYNGSFAENAVKVLGAIEP